MNYEQDNPIEMLKFYSNPYNQQTSNSLSLDQKIVSDYLKTSDGSTINSLSSNSQQSSFSENLDVSIQKSHDDGDQNVVVDEFLNSNQASATIFKQKESIGNDGYSTVANKISSNENLQNFVSTNNVTDQLWRNIPINYPDFLKLYYQNAYVSMKNMNMLINKNDRYTGTIKNNDLTKRSSTNQIINAKSFNNHVAINHSELILNKPSNVYLDADVFNYSKGLRMCMLLYNWQSNPKHMQKFINSAHKIFIRDESINYRRDYYHNIFDYYNDQKSTWLTNANGNRINYLRKHFVRQLKGYFISELHDNSNKLSYKQRQVRECSFCATSGKMDWWYTTHSLKDKSKEIVTCPILRAYKCKHCGNEDPDKAHSDGYCLNHRKQLFKQQLAKAMAQNEMIRNARVQNQLSGNEVNYIPTW